MFGIKEKKESTVHLKEKGVIPNNLCTLLCELVSLDSIPAQKCVDAFKRIASTLGIDVEGDILPRSINRVVKEGGMAAKIHMVEAFKDASVSTVDKDGQRKEFFLGITMAVNHTSETQQAEWIALIEELYHLYCDSPFCEGNEDERDFWAAVCGMHTDHAEDQKKLFRLLQAFKQRLERERHGEKAVLSMSTPDLVRLLIRVSAEAVESIGGQDAWEKLSDEEQKALHTTTYLKVVQEIGQEEFSKLSPEEQAKIDLFLWVGCCMHKEMNAFKGGATAMENFWSLNNLPLPVRMYNHDNDAASSLAPGTDAAKRADEKSKGGAIKVSSLSGTIYRHKDRKRGQQDTLQFFLHEELSFCVEFPDTSNTRFQSHAQACAIIITYRDLFLKFLQLVEDNKTGRKLNHLEQNVRKGLQCNYTLHEFAAVTLYHQTISIPYMREIRGPSGSTEHNVLCLGPFHERLKTHLAKLINNPEIVTEGYILAKWQTAMFDGKPWEQPDAIEAVLKYLPELPHLKPLFVAFCKGALETWKRFTSEFEPGTAISNASSEQKARASMAKTNDLNESQFRSSRHTMRSNPSMSLSQYNARQMFKKNNGVPERLRQMNADERKSLRKMTRQQDESGEDCLNRDRMMSSLHQVAKENIQKDQRVAERKKKSQQRVDAAGNRVFRSLHELEVASAVGKSRKGYLTNTEIDLQLDWFRQEDEHENPEEPTMVCSSKRVERSRILSSSGQGDGSKEEVHGSHQELDDGNCTETDSEAEFYGNRK
ncbi:hypothetical protein K435DRAFT_824682 [Dendrothele bispora CBS 962.96]|uniref:Uncharacterized protein n=1 Tax=Dendrothele bispora (strain CBS 962.96) TaxID=1314807 RepID=A0A4S8KJZ9_DENBC|nr:hypothetical protein K435DRAFT_824682 [Dendrothele bispora CBS 962.96]